MGRTVLRRVRRVKNRTTRVDELFRAEYFVVFTMQTIVILERRGAPIGNPSVVSRIPGGASMHILRIHVPLDAREMANELAGRHATGRRFPLEIVVADELHDSSRSFMHAIEVVEKRPNPRDFHES